MFATKLCKTFKTTFKTNFKTKLFTANFGSVALQRTNTYHFDPAFVLERDEKVKNGILGLMPTLTLDNYTPDNISVYFPTKNEKYTMESLEWKHQIQYEYWFRFIDKYCMEDPFMKPYGIINDGFNKRVYNNVEEFKFDVDNIFFGN